MNIMKFLKICLVLVVLFGTFLTGNVYAADPAFNILSNDFQLLLLENRSTNPAWSTNPNWRDPISASAGDLVSFNVYYHNGVEGTTATNTRLRIAYPTVAATSIVTTGYIISDNAAQISNTGTINVSTAQTLTFDGTAYWYPNQTTSNPTPIAVTNTGTYVEVNIGSVNGGWPSQGNVVFRATISNVGGGATNPIVDAGTNLSMNEAGVVTLSGSATDPNNLAMTYSWSCSGGTLSSSTILTPVYTAPAVAVDTTHICTLTATNSANLSASDTVSILVRNVGGGGVGAPVVDAGADRDIGENQSITLVGSAVDPQGDAMTYSWSCSGGGISNGLTLTPTYTAPSVTADTTYFCTLVATDTSNNAGSDSAIITVRNSGGGGSGGSGSGGSGSPMLNVALSATPSSGPIPLEDVDLSAVVYADGISNRTAIYRFDCMDDDSWELRVESSNRNYTAQDICTYDHSGTYTARVQVELGGYIATNSTRIIVGSGTSSYGIDAEAGINKTIFENQSVALTGTAYSYFGSALKYYWSCNGGSLSNTTTLTPTYYAPSVDADTTYACTLFVTDARGYRNSDTVSITVKNGTGYGTNLRVTTNNPETVTSTTAVLKGTLNNDGGQYTAVRFNWGRLTSYSNSTPWIYNRITGNVFTNYISGLEKGKAYHYRVEASNGREVVVGGDVAFVTAPDPTTGFTATSFGTSQINLSWNNGAASCYTMVTRKVGSYPTNSSDGTIVYYGKGTSYSDKNLNPGTMYYYRAWSVGCDEGLYSFSASQYARAYTSAGEYVQTTTTTETGVEVDALARNLTQNEVAWQETIVSNINDEVEFKVIIIPTGTKSLNNVVLKNNISDKIESINTIEINGQSYSGSVSEMKLGEIPLGDSKVVTFKGKIGSVDKLSYGFNDIENTIEVSATGVDPITKIITISVSRPLDAAAALSQFLNLKFYAGLMTLLFIILCLAIFYLLIERKKGRECLVEKDAETKVNKSKYFNIK